MHAHICRSPEHQHGLPYTRFLSLHPGPRLTVWSSLWFAGEYTHIPNPQQVGEDSDGWLPQQPAPAQAVTHSICQWGASDLPVPPYLVLGTHIIPTSVVGCRDPPLLQQLRPRFHWLQQLPAQPEVPTAWTNSRGWHPVPHAR